MKSLPVNALFVDRNAVPLSEQELCTKDRVGQLTRR